MGLLAHYPLFELIPQYSQTIDYGVDGYYIYSSVLQPTITDKTGLTAEFPEIHPAFKDTISITVDQKDCENGVAIWVNGTIVATINDGDMVRSTKTYSVPASCIRTNAKNIINITSASDRGWIYSIKIESAAANQFVEDISGNDIHATAYGVPAFVNMSVGKGYAFDGASHIRVPLDTNTIKSMAFKISIPSVAAAHGKMILGSQNPSNARMYLGIQNSYISMGIGSNSWGSSNGPTPVTDGDIFDVVMTYDGADAKLYINGEYKVTKSSAWATSIAPGIDIGTVLDEIGDNSTYKIIANIQDVRFYDHVLSAKEVKEISKRLALHYDFEEQQEYVNDLYNRSVLPLTDLGGRGITYNYIGIEDGYHKYSISGTWTGGAYPYSFHLKTSSSFYSTIGAPYSIQAKIKVSCPEKFHSSFGTIMIVNDASPQRSGTQSRVGELSKSEWAVPGTSIPANPAYVHSMPVADGTAFDPTVDFMYIKDVQIENKEYCSSVIVKDICLGDIFTLKKEYRFPDETQHAIRCDMQPVPEASYYLASADVSLRQEDTATDHRINITLLYSDGTSDSVNGFFNNIIKDGTFRNLAVRINATKLVKEVRVWMADYSTIGTRYISLRNIKVEAYKINTTNIGNIFDKSPYKRDAVLNSLLSPRWIPSTYSGIGAYLFKSSESGGSGDRINLSSPLFQDNLKQEWTVIGKLRLRVTNKQNMLVSGLNLGLRSTHGTGRQALLYLNDGSDDYYIYGAVDAILPEVDVDIAFVFRNSDARRKIYVNGVDVATGHSVNLTSTPEGILSNWMLGHIDGVLHDFKVFARVFTPAEVLEEYQNRAYIDNAGNIHTGNIDSSVNFDEVSGYENLVYNGDFRLGTTDGFIKDSSGSMGYNSVDKCIDFTHSGTQTIWCDKYIEINPNDEYEFEIDVRYKGTSAICRAYLGFECYDEDLNVIGAWNYMKFNGNTSTHTTLAQQLNPGDTTVHLASAANWSGVTPGVENHTKTIGFWGNLSKYKKYSYTRINRPYLNIDYGNNTIQLSAPWSGEVVAAGTPVANMMSGSTFVYPTQVPLLELRKYWTRHKSHFSYKNYEYGGRDTTDSYKFRPGTKFIKFRASINRDVTGTTTTQISRLVIYNKTRHQTLLDSSKIVDRMGMSKFLNMSQFGITSGLMAWYLRDGSLKDEQCNFADLTKYGNPPLEDVSGFGKAYKFGVLEEYFRTPIIPMKYAFTYSLTLKMISIPEYRNILWGAVSDSLIIGVGSTDIRFYLKNSDNENSGYKIVVTSTMNIQHITFAFTMTKCIIYLDGAQVLEFPFKGELEQAAYNIGAAYNGQVNVNAYIRDVKFWNRVLSPEEVKLNYLYDTGQLNKVVQTKETLYLPGKIDTL